MAIVISSRGMKVIYSFRFVMVLAITVASVSMLLRALYRAVEVVAPFGDDVSFLIDFFAMASRCGSVR